MKEKGDKALILYGIDEKHCTINKVLENDRYNVKAIVDGKELLVKNVQVYDETNRKEITKLLIKFHNTIKVRT